MITNSTQLREGQSGTWSAQFKVRFQQEMIYDPQNKHFLTHFM